MARRKRQVREAPLGPPVTTKNHRFGWCTTGHHSGCRYEFTYYEHTYQCSCECHEQSTEKKQKKTATRQKRTAHDSR